MDKHQVFRLAPALSVDRKVSSCFCKKTHEKVPGITLHEWWMPVSSRSSERPPQP